MAEARLAVAFQFQVTDEGSLRVNLDRKLLFSIGLSILRQATRRYQRVRNAALRAIYPASPYTLLALLCTFALVQYLLPDNATLSAWQSYLPGISLLPDSTEGPVAALLLAVIVWTAGLYIQRTLLMLALYYKGFLFVPHGKTPLKVRLWFALVKLLRGPWRPSSVYAYQSALPRLPVPSISDTCRRYLETARPLNNDEQYSRLRQLAEDFEKGLGRRLQRYLWLKWIWSNNYVSDWWEKYVYLRGRSPLMINSNYYILDSFIVPTSFQSARAASLTYWIGNFRQDLETEAIEPFVIQGTVPVCMNQYRRAFGTCRVADTEQDTLEHVSGTKSAHVAVLRRGRYYRVPLLWNGCQLQPVELEQFFKRILDDDNTAEPATASELNLPAMTAGGRTEWANFRQKFLLSNPKNRRTLNMIESAAFFMILEDEEVVMRIDDDDSITAFGHKGLHGNGINRWFDKSICIAVHSNAMSLCTAEHSWADAPVVAHILEYAYAREWMKKSEFFGADGHCQGTIRCPPRTPERLTWELPGDCDSLLNEAHLSAKALIADLDLYVFFHRQFGKGAIKKCKVSPDAFIQMALQLAYFRDVGHFSLTYEASMTRMYREGRTETVRPVTGASVAFVHAMNDPSVPAEEKRALLIAATDKHQDNYRNAMAGNGVDRHLFTLYVVSKYLNVDSPFLKEVLSEPWRLSTSQTPHSQMSDTPRHPDLHSPGGGFGPVADDGYGVSYIIVSDEKMFFHISSKHSSSNTNSRRFAENVCRASREMIELFGVKV